MLNKKIWMLAIILLSLISVSAVSATNHLDLADVNEDIVSIDNDNLLTVDENDTILDDVGTFNDLENQINNVEDGGTLSLIKDYKAKSRYSYISISKSITIDGQGHTLDGNNLTRIFYISANNVVLKNINFVNGNYEYGYGGAIYFNSNLNSTIINSNFVNCSSLAGGAVFLDTNCNCSIIDSNFNNNVAEILGGGLITGGKCNVNLLRTSFTKGLARYESGGAIMLLNSNLNADYLEITDCYSEFGGAISSLSSNFNISHSKFINNGAHYDGGAIFAKYNSVNLYDTVFSDNYAKRGGGVYISQTNNSLIDNQFIHNSASNAGAIYIMSSTGKIMSGNTFKNNVGSPQADFYETNNDNLTIVSDDYYQFRYHDTTYVSLPNYYNLDDEGFLTPVKDQGTDGNCWAFSAMAALESCILKASGLSFDLSEANLKNLMAYYSDYGRKIGVNKGGYSEMSWGYLASWLGPINEEDDSYYINDFLSPLLSSLFHVQNILFLKRNDYTDNDGIKNAILNYGAVSTNMYYSSSYLKNSVSYYYPGSLSTNHAVCIVGWDDNYSKNNFKNTPSGDGAWIVRNSWGPDWGDGGYFYVSYYDNMFAQVNQTKAYTFIFNDTKKFNRIYQLEIQPTSYRSTGDVACYKNIFNVEGEEYLAAVSTYFQDECNYKVSIYLNDILVSSKIGKTNAGYYTINLDDLIYLNKNDKVAVVFNCTNFKSGEGKIPYSAKIFCSNLFTNSGVSYYWNNNKWVDFSDVVCIKMFTTFSIEDKLDPYFEITSQANNYDNSNTISFILPNDATGLISININGKEHIIDVSNDKSVKFYDLNDNNNTLIIKYSGDDKYLEKSVVYVVDTHISQTGTFEDLSNLINKFEGSGVLSLTKDYYYVPGSTGEIHIEKSITIDGNGHTINGNGMINIFYVGAKNVVLKNINFVGGNSTYGGSISIHASKCSVINCSFIDNTGEYGGAVYWSGLNGFLADCSFVNNHASDGSAGAVYWFSGSGVLTNCSFINNSARHGGAINWFANNGIVGNCSFVNNHASDGLGGAINWFSPGGVIGNCSFKYNSANYGGAVYWDSNEGFLDNCSFSYNSARSGGAVYWKANECVLYDCYFNDNYASNYNGGSVYLDGNLDEIINCSFVDNRASSGRGGAVYSTKNDTKVSNCYFLNNYASNNGGAIYIAGESGILADCIFINNSVPSSKSEGGAIYWNNKQGLIINCLFDNNSAYGGNAISLYGNNTSLDNCTFVNNFANGAGAAIYLVGSDCQVTNSYFINNGAAILSGAIFLVSNNNVISHCYFINNSAPNGGAIILNGVNNILRDSIFENNIASDLGGAIYMQEDGCSLNNCSFINNGARNGGAILWAAADGLLNNCLFQDNLASENGSAVYWYGDRGILSNSTFIDNINVNQVYWWNTQTGTIVDCKFINNTHCVINRGATFIKRHVDLITSNYIFDYKNPSIVSVRPNILNNLPINSDITFILSNGKNSEIFTVTLNNDVASIFNELLELNAGDWTVNAIFDGDDNYYSSSTVFTITINPIKTSLNIECSDVTLDNESILVATIGNAYNFIVNEGSVTFYDGGVTIGTSEVKSNVARLSYTPTIAGEHLITAVYSGNNYLSSSGSAMLLVGSGSVGTNAKIVPVNLNAEYRSGEFTFKLLDSNTNKPLSNKQLKYTVITGSINTVGTITTDENGIALIDNRYLTIYTLDGGNIEAKAIPVGNQLFTLESDDASVICEKIQDYFTITKVALNINFVYYGNEKKVVINVTNAKTEEPMCNVVIHVVLNDLPGFDYHVQTNLEGLYELDISNLTDGLYILKVSNNDTQNIEYNLVEKIITVSSSYGTFEELNNLINMTSEGKTLILTKDYKYISGSTDGININKPITIDGQGHTLDGNTLSKIFNVISENVLLKNISFVNVIITDKDGAINWKGSNGKLIDCDFINFSSNYPYSYYSGGSAICWFGLNGVISNCNFSNCYSNLSNGGAIRWVGENGDLINCNFNDCYACYGGAVCWQGIGGNLNHCVFVNCSAQLGGAIVGVVNNVYINNSNFINCYSNKHIKDKTGCGSAIFWEKSDYIIISNCNFIDNQVKDLISCYGVICLEYCDHVLVDNCLFINNTDTEYDCLIYVSYCDYFIMDSCNFINNLVECPSIYFTDSEAIINNTFFSKDFNNVKSYRTDLRIIKKVPELNANNLVFYYKNPSNFSIILKDNEKGIVNKTIMFDIKLGNISKKFTKNTDFEGFCSIFYELNDLDVGIWNVTIIFEGNDNYVPCNATATIAVILQNTSLTVSDANTTVNHGIALIANVVSNLIVNEGYVIFLDDGNIIGEALVSDGVATLFYTPKTEGKHIITAVFNSNHYSSSKGSANLLVDSASVDVSVDNGIVGYNSTFVANVKGLYSIINEGTVSFYVGGNFVGKSPVVNGVASLTYVPLLAGNFMLKAIFGESGRFSNVELSVVYIVNLANSRLFINNVSGTVFHEITLSSCVTSSNNLIIDEGTVTFRDNGNTIGSAKVVNGVASLSYTPNIAGEHLITAVYSGDNYLSSSGSASLLVDSASVDVSVDNGIVGYNSTFVANVKGLYSIINEGTVSFYVDGDFVGKSPVVNGVASLTYTPLISGNFMIKVVYSGERFTNSESSVIYIVNPATSRTFIDDVSGTVFHEITLTSNVVSFNNLVINDGAVTFTDNGNVIGVAKVVNGVASLNYIPTTSGDHMISTSYLGNNYLSSNNAIIISIAKEITQISSSAVSTIYNGDKYLVATLKDAQGNPIQGLTVLVNLNGVKKLTTDVNGQVKLTTNALVPKTYTTTIVFVGDDNYVGSSATVKVTVTKATPKLTASAKTFKVNVKTKQYTVTLKDNKNKAMNKAKVTIKVNGKTFSATTNSKGQATFKITNLNKKATFKATVTYAATSCYNKVTKNVKITVK